LVVCFTMSGICDALCKHFRASRETQYQQFLILGPANAGKTALLYRLKFGRRWHGLSEDLLKMRLPGPDSVPRDDKTRANDPDAGFHYEEFGMMNNCGLWDIPAHLSHSWPIWYNNLLIHGIFFVVEADERDAQVLTEIKYDIRRLLSEDALRKAGFAIIINTREGRVTSSDASSKDHHPLYYKLGLYDLPEEAALRLKAFRVDINSLEGEKDSQWAPIVTHMKAVLRESYGFQFSD